MEGNKLELKKLESLFDAQGRDYVSNQLSKSTDFRKSVLQIQKELSLGSKRCEPMLQFLDLLGCPRSTVYRSLLDSTKTALEVQLEKLDHAALQAVLEETIGCITIRELKSIPISIIRSLNVVPDRYLMVLSKSGLM